MNAVEVKPTPGMDEARVGDAAYAQLRAGVERVARRVVREESAEGAGNIPRELIELLGKLLDRLPDALSVAEVGRLLDGLNLVLHSHDVSCSVARPGAVTPGAPEVTVQAVDGSPAVDTLAGAVEETPAPDEGDASG